MARKRRYLWTEKIGKKLVKYYQTNNKKTYIISKNGVVIVRFGKKHSSLAAQQKIVQKVGKRIIHGSKKKPVNVLKGKRNSKLEYEILDELIKDFRPITKKFKVGAELRISHAADAYGSIYRGKKVIYVRVLKLSNGKPRRYSAIVRTVIHELGHIAFPSLPENHKELQKFRENMLEHARERGVYMPRTRIR